jgi:hypothetical protein
MAIAIDQRVVGTGQWAGMLAPGTHLVQVYGPGGMPFTAQIFVVAGKPLNVRASAGRAAVPILTAPPPPLPPPKKKEPPPPPPKRQGPYGLVLASLLWPVTHPPSFPKPDSQDFGAEYGLRGGYQVNTYAGFDLTFQHSSITTSSKFYADDKSYYRVISNRIALGLRLLTAGRTWRLAGAVGGGVIIDSLTFSLASTDIQDECTKQNEGKPCPLLGKINKMDPLPSSFGANAFVYTEAGIEIDIDHVLINPAFEGEFQATGGIGLDGRIYDGKSLIRLGVALRVGYRFW